MPSTVKLHIGYTCATALPCARSETLLLRIYLTHRSPVTQWLQPDGARSERSCEAHIASVRGIVVTQHRLTGNDHLRSQERTYGPQER
ncbi:hypothetical protein CRENBAI_001329 [Crenichthys baileyi]|uniref:Uncharacterized protein n=1 Tax=Crenichthys baileyi TaxID=28760 RepID=A0AAV9QX30_9TELE